MTGAQVDLRFEFQRFVRYVDTPEAADHFVQVHQHLVQGERFAYAVSWPGREWHVGETWALCLVLRRESLGPEHVRILPETRMSVQQVQRQQDVAACGNIVTAQYIRLDCAARQQPAGRVQ